MTNRRTYWSIDKGESLNRWGLAAAKEQYFPGTARPMPDAVDYRFINGWVDTGDLPCREALRELLARRDIVVPDGLVFPEVYLGGDDPRVDFSTFRFRPTLVTRWLRCSLFSAQAQTTTFTVETCGGVHIWLNGSKVVQLDHYQRNEPTVQQVSFDVSAGDNDILVFLEDLHERDTSCYFLMTLVKGSDLKAGIELDLDEQYAKEIERTLDGLRTDKVFYHEEMVRIVADYLPQVPVRVRLDTGSHPSETVTMNVLLDGMKMDRDIAFTVDQQFSVADLFDSTGLKAGCVSLRFIVEVDKTCFSRTLGTTLLSPPQSMHMPELAQRKQAALQHMLVTGKDEPARALAALAQNQNLELAERIIKQALKPIHERHDCADFWILPLIWMYRSYAGTLLADEVWEQIREAILGFRYWLDEPGDDVMWFWSENHVLCFHVAQYLAGSLFPDEKFSNSGKTGQEHKQQAFLRLQRWFDSVDSHGLAEWNSAAYYPIDFLGLFTLMVNADDAEMSQRARGLIDQIFIMVALHTINGVCAGSQGRVYEKELLAGPVTELGSIAAVAFGGDWYPGYDRVSALLALSDYEPPKAARELLQVRPGQHIYAKYTQGLDHNAKVTLWKSPSVQLSTVSDYKTGIKGHQQHFLDVQTNAHAMARFWINHPGDMKVWGGSRPSYWAGNAVHPRVAQYKNMGFMIFDHRAFPEVINFTHIFAPKLVCDEFVVDHNWLFARTGSALIGVFASAELQALEHGLYAGYEWRVHGPQSAWVVMVAEIGEYESLVDFQQACRNRGATFDAQSNTVSIQHDDGAIQLNYQQGLTLNGEQQAFAPLTVVPNVALNDGELQPWTQMN
ncbi:hypothetical protein [Gynuella sp.]|uniref:hypothetical protein n=1 Tax=Gynuella sp. TaxID=2969146 RepID=UPI003D101CE1